MLQSSPAGLRCLGALFTSLLFCAAASAQAVNPTDDDSLSELIGKQPGLDAPAPADIVVHNRLVTVLRRELLGFSAADRAKGAIKRINAILDKNGPGEISAHEVREGRGFTIDGEFAFFLTPGDVYTAGGETLDSTARNAVAALEFIIQERDERRDPKAVAIGVGLAAGATVVFAILMWMLVVTNRWMRQKGSAALLNRARAVKIAGVSAIELGQFMRGVRYLVTVVSWVLGVLVTYVWLVFVLERFAHTRAWGENLLELLLGSAGHFLRAIVGSIPGLITVVIIFVLARWVARLAGAFFSRVEAGRVSMAWLDADTAGPTRRIVTVVIWLFALAMAYPYLPGAQTDAFKGLSVLVGLMISIGASNLVGQAASGLILMYARSYRPGEFVRIGDTEGAVTELGLFSTRLRTGFGEEVMLPNSLVLSQTAKNFSRASPDDGYLLESAVTISYAAPWRQVHAMLLESANRTQGVLTEPAPQVIQSALSDFYVQYSLVCHADSKAVPVRLDALGNLHANIQDVFNEHGVQIMSPHYMLDPAQAQVVPPARWFAAPAAPESGDAKKD